MEEQNTQNTKSEPTDVQSEVSQNTSENSNTTAKKPFTSGPMLLTVGAIIVGLLLVAFVLYGQKATDSEGKTEVESADYPAVVAVVNGEEISGEDFGSAVSRTTFSATQQGVDTSDPSMRSEIESQSLEMLINTELLLQAAVEAGVSVDEADIETRMSEIEAQLGGAESFEAELENLGLTVEEVREDVYADLLITAYLAQNESYSVTVTDEDVATAYETYAAQGAQLPPLEEIADVIEQQLVSEAEQAAASAVIELLRAEAEVEVNI